MKNNKFGLFISLILLVSSFSCGNSRQSEVFSSSSSEDTTMEESSSLSSEVIKNEITPQEFDITNKNYIHYLGRYVENSNGIKFSLSCSGFLLKINVLEDTNSLFINILSKLNSYSNQYVKTYIDGVKNEILTINNGEHRLEICSSLSKGEHIVEFKKMTEASFSSITLKDIEFNNINIQRYDEEKKVIEFYGDSISCGYGNLSNGSGFSTETEDGTLAYTQLTADILGYENRVVAYSGISLAKSPFNVNYTMMDRYLLADTTSSWDITSHQVDVIVVNLGTNDNTKLNTLSSQKEKEEMTNLFYQNLKTMLFTLKEASPNANIVLAYNMMLKISDYFSIAFSSVEKDIIAQYGECIYDLEFTPNYDGVDGHPSAEGHQKNAQILANFIQMMFN